MMRRAHAISMSAILAAASLATGCSRQAGARLAVREVSTWAMPPVGHERTRW